MCIGVPMIVIESDEMSAVVEVDGERCRVGMLLVGVQPAGARVLVHAGTALRVLSDDEAAAIEDALRALAEAEAGLIDEARTEHFADLGRPELPAHLRGGSP